MKKGYELHIDCSSHKVKVLRFFQNLYNSYYFTWKGWTNSNLWEFFFQIFWARATEVSGAGVSSDPGQVWMNGWVVILFWEGIDSDSTAMKLETENGFLQPKMEYDYE